MNAAHNNNTVKSCYETLLKLTEINRHRVLVIHSKMADNLQFLQYKDFLSSLMPTCAFNVGHQNVIL